MQPRASSSPTSIGAGAVRGRARGEPARPHLGWIRHGSITPTIRRFPSRHNGLRSLQARLPACRWGRAATASVGGVGQQPGPQVRTQIVASQRELYDGLQVGQFVAGVMRSPRTPRRACRRRLVGVDERGEGIGELDLATAARGGGVQHPKISGAST